MIAAALLLLLAQPAPAASPDATPAAAQLDPAKVADEAVAGLEKTVARADADIVAEVEAGGYRIGLLFGPPRPLRPRMASGRFTDPDPPNPETTFVGVVLREPRTKRFLPAAHVRANLEMEGGGEISLAEYAGAYPLYGTNVLIPRPGTVRGPKGPDDLRAITITVRPPHYDRHAEMLGTFHELAVHRFEVKPRAGATSAPWHEISQPSKPAPHAADWKIGTDVRQALEETKSLTRAGNFVMGFVAEGPEPIWLWKGMEHPPEHVAVKPGEDTHLELVLLHVPTGQMVTGAEVVYRLWRRTKADGPREEKEFRLHPLLAEFYHYGLTADVPEGEWNVAAFAKPPRIEAWGEGEVPVPEGVLTTTWTWVKEPGGDHEGGGVSRRRWVAIALGIAVTLGLIALGRKR